MPVVLTSVLALSVILIIILTAFEFLNNNTNKKTDSPCILYGLSKTEMAVIKLPAKWARPKVNRDSGWTMLGFILTSMSSDSITLSLGTSTLPDNTTLKQYFDATELSNSPDRVDRILLARPDAIYGASPREVSPLTFYDLNFASEKVVLRLLFSRGTLPHLDRANIAAYRNELDEIVERIVIAKTQVAPGDSYWSTVCPF